MRIPITNIALISIIAASNSALAQSASEITWTGPYVGVTLGYGGGNFKDSLSGTTDAAGTGLATGWLNQSSSGVLGGGQVGYNYETPSGIVFGLETDLSAADIGANTSLSNISGAGSTTSGALSSKIDYLGTVRGRVGKAMFDGRFMPYLTGGFAYGGVKSTTAYGCTGCAVTSFATPTLTQTGWTAGTGAEYALTRHLSMKAEYLYTDLGRDMIATNATEFSVGGANLYNANVSEKATANVVRVGLNYRF